MSLKAIAKILLLISFLAAKVESKAQLAFNHTVENGAIPKDFEKNENAVLMCILHGQKSYDKYLIKNVEENYFGKYIFIPFAERNSEKYADTTIYRYRFDREQLDRVSGDGVTNKFYIADRATHQRYTNSGTSSFFGKMIIAYMTGLEKVRLENQGKK